MSQWLGKLLISSESALLFIASILSFFAVPPASEFQRLYGNGHIAKILFIHVPLAIVSFAAFIAAGGFGITYLRTKKQSWDALVYATVEVAWLYAMLATLTGSWFSKLAWGTFWHWDIRQTTMFMVLLTYTAYLLIRGAIEDEQRRGAVSAVYVIMGAIASVFLYFVVPYLPPVQQISLHPSGIIARGGLDSYYLSVLLLSFFAMSLLFIQLVRLRASILWIEFSVNRQLLKGVWKDV